MLFKKKPSQRMLKIEINDQKIDNDISKLILDVEKQIKLLQDSLKKNDYVAKDVLDKKLVDKFMKMMKDTDMLIEDVYKIRALDLQQKEYIKIKDVEGYLVDKLEQLETIKQNLNSLIDMFKQTPSDKELERDLLDEFFKDLNNIIESLNKIKEDDRFLKKQYEMVVKAL